MNYYVAISYTGDRTRWFLHRFHLGECISRCEVLLSDARLATLFPTIGRLLKAAKDLLDEDVRRYPNAPEIGREIDVDAIINATNGIPAVDEAAGQDVPLTNFFTRTTYCPVEQIVAMIDFGVPNMYYPGEEVLGAGNEVNVPNMFYENCSLEEDLEWGASCLLRRGLSSEYSGSETEEDDQGDKAEDTGNGCLYNVPNKVLNAPHANSPGASHTTSRHRANPATSPDLSSLPLLPPPEAMAQFLAAGHDARNRRLASRARRAAQQEE